jgi:hypothetical protein
MTRSKNQIRYYLVALAAVLVFASGVGIGYIWAAGKVIQVWTAVTCNFPAIIT